MEYTSTYNKGKPEDVNIQPVGLPNTRISTCYAQNSPRSLMSINATKSSRAVSLKAKRKKLQNLRQMTIHDMFN